jgi:RNA polymerase sigma factor (sigma-70 family)
MLIILILVLVVFISLGDSLRVVKKSRTYQSLSSSLSSQEELLSSSLLLTPLKPSTQANALRWVSLANKIRTDIQASSITDVSKNMGFDTSKILFLLNKSHKLEQILIQCNMCLVNSIANKYQDRGLDYDDLLFEGVKGLRKAVSKFDSKHGTKFSTYAYYWVSFYIKAALANQSSAISLPHHTYRLAIKVRSTVDRLSSLGITPTDEAIAKELNINMETFEICKRAVSLLEKDETNVQNLEKQQVFDESTWEVIKNSEIDSNDNTASLLSSAPLPNAVTNLRSNEVHDALHDALSRLPIGESKAIYERLGLLDIIPNFDFTSDKKKLPSYQSKMTKDDSKTLYLKGIRRLRRLLNDKRFPEIKNLENILLNSVEGFIEKKGGVRKVIPNML